MSTVWPQGRAATETIGCCQSSTQPGPAHHSSSEWCELWLFRKGSGALPKRCGTRPRTRRYTIYAYDCGLTEHLAPSTSTPRLMPIPHRLGRLTGSTEAREDPSPHRTLCAHRQYRVVQLLLRPKPKGTGALVYMNVGAAVVLPGPDSMHRHAPLSIGIGPQPYALARTTSAAVDPAGSEAVSRKRSPSTETVALSQPAPESTESAPDAET